MLMGNKQKGVFLKKGLQGRSLFWKEIVNNHLQQKKTFLKKHFLDRESKVSLKKTIYFSHSMSLK